MSTKCHLSDKWWVSQCISHELLVI